MDIESTLSGHNLAFLEALYEAYEQDPNSVDPQWVPILRELGGSGAAPGLGADGLRVRAVVGPAICGRCYEVPHALRAEVGAVVPEAAATTSWGTPSLDLPAGVLAQLEAAGVAARALPVCTREDPRLFSHRRDGLTGRFAGVIATRR